MADRVGVFRRERVGGSVAFLIQHIRNLIL
jgi:hypothetical protein